MITIIGGGVFGLSIGWTLARQQQPVTLLEQGQVGHGATWAAAGMLMPWKLSDNFSAELFALQRESYHLWPEFANLLTAMSGEPLDYQTDGRYFLALSPQAMRRLERQYDYHHDIGFSLEWLAGDEARLRVPALGPKVKAAVFTPLAHHVDNRQLVSALRQAFLQAGGQLREYAPVLELLSSEAGVAGVRLADETILSETVILAAGAWSGQIGGLPTSLQDVIKPRKGQTIILQMPPQQPLIDCPLIGPVYLVPRPDGRLIVGATVERDAGFDTQPTVQGAMRILRKAREMVPAVKDLPVIEFGAGLRPTGPQRLPVLGVTSLPGLLMAGGGHSYGILLSPVVAQAMAHLALTGETVDLIKPFTPPV